MMEEIDSMPVVMYSQDNTRVQSRESLVPDPASYQIELWDANLSIAYLGVDLKHVVGCGHDKCCALCVILDSMPGDEEDKEAIPSTAMERLAVVLSNYRITDRSIARDALTWMSAYNDWMLSYHRMLYFTNNYTVLSDAAKIINRLPPVLLDSRATTAFRQSMERREYTPALTYCSWPFIPKPGLSEIFYVRTKLPPLEQIMHYLNIVFDLPLDLVKEITFALAPPNKPKALVLGQLKRRLSECMLSSPPSSPRLKLDPDGLDEESWTMVDRHRQEEYGADGMVELYGPGADPRHARSVRLAMSSAPLRAQFDCTLPHMSLVSETGDVDELQLRPDYVLRPHERYVNIFYITLPPHAPLVWKEEETGGDF